MKVGRVFVFIFALMVLLLAGAGTGQKGGKSGGAGAGAGNGSGGGETIEKATFTAGQVVQVDDKEAGADGYYLVYVPKDYAADKSWPVIVNVGNMPNISMFRGATKGSGFVVVGVQAVEDSVDLEVAKVKKIMAALSARLKFDSKQMVIGGAFGGGASAGAIAEASPDMWAGLIIIGTNKTSLTGAHVTGAGMAGKPVFVGTGDRDGAKANLPPIVEHYRAAKAEVTEVMFKGAVGISPDDETVYNWLTQSGSKAAKEAYEAAEKLEKSGKAGAAYAAFLAVEKIENAGSLSKMAKDQAAAIESKAQDKLAAAIVLAGDGKYAQARAAFEAVAGEYAGSPFAEQALARVKDIDGNPAIAAAQQQGAVDAKADAAESAARAVESHGDFAAARGMFEKYVAAFPTATHFQEVKAHLEELKANPASTRPAATAADAMDKDCKGTMMLVDSYVKNGNAEKALPLLAEMIKKYPGSTWATAAAAKEEEIKKGI